MPSPADVSVMHYRFRNNDGSESSATWMAAEDTNAVKVITGDTTFRLRLVIADTSGSSSSAYGINVSHNLGTPKEVDFGNTYVNAPLGGSGLTDGGNTTEQLTLDSGYTYVTTAGQVSYLSVQSATISLSPNDETELEFAMQLTYAQLSSGDTLDFTLISLSVGPPTIAQYGSVVRLTVDLTP